MSLKEWFEIKKKEKKCESGFCETKIDDESLAKIWAKCFNCNESLLNKDLNATMRVCPSCGYHFRITAKERICQLVDDGIFEEIDESLSPADPLEFVDTVPYTKRQEKAKQKSGLNDAVITGFGKIHGENVALAIMDFEYMGGSMGSVVGEKITRLIENAVEHRIPIIVITSSGGARMQESALSLMQMAKTSCAIARANEEKVLYMTVLTEPTFGGVTASFGALGDIIIAEKGARIGFAGRRVIEQTIRQKLPADFQTAEYLLKYGHVDIVCERKDLKNTLATAIKLHNKSLAGEKVKK